MLLLAVCYCGQRVCALHKSMDYATLRSQQQQQITLYTASLPLLLLVFIYQSRPTDRPTIGLKGAGEFWSGAMPIR
jgi:hypothetical protein